MASPQEELKLDKDDIRLCAYNEQAIYQETDSEEEWEDEQISLYYAVTTNDLCTLKYLIQDGLNINKKFRGPNHLDKTPLHLACEFGHVEMVEFLISQGANPTAVDAWYQAPLTYVVSTLRDNLIDIILKAPGCDVNQRDRFGKAALHYASGHGDVMCIRLLLKGGADIDIRDEVGRTALWVSATEEGRIEVLRVLVEAGANINAIDEREKRTPMQAAIMHTNVDTQKYVQFFIEAGARLDTRDMIEHTPLMSIVRKHRLDKTQVRETDLRLARMLLDAGCNANQKSWGRHWFQMRGTVINMAAERGASDFVELFLKYGADPDIYDNNVVTSLLSAANGNHIDVARLLIASNCRPAVVGQVKMRGELIPMTPFKCCIIKEHWEFAELLVFGGYDLSGEEYFLTNENVPRQLMENFDFWTWLHGYFRNPLRLNHLCRLVIRNHLRFPVLASIDKLGLAPGMRNFLMFKYIG